MRLKIVLLTAWFAGPAIAQEASPRPNDAAVKRGLAFLVKDALAWKKEHNCVSCHHAGMVVWALREAKQRGHAVDEPVLAELTKWLAESGDGKASLPRPKGIPQALNVKPVWVALALAADPQPDMIAQKGLQLLWKTIKSDQTANGSWASWPETRPPMFGHSDESMTALATLALVSAAESGDGDARTAVTKGIRWLSDAKSDDELQSLAMRIVVLRRAGRPAADWQSLVRRILERQSGDGGWSQSNKMSSDAWATGQALYALAHAGSKLSEPAVRRGRAFLARNQRDDGSWAMTSRPTKPSDRGATSLIPITGAGSAWAVLGLVRSDERPGR